MLLHEVVVFVCPFVRSFTFLVQVQVNALTNIEAKKKYEFLESISAIMDAHLRYFKLVCLFNSHFYTSYLSMCLAFC